MTIAKKIVSSFLIMFCALQIWIAPIYFFFFLPACHSDCISYLEYAKGYISLWLHVFNFPLYPVLAGIILLIPLLIFWIFPRFATGFLLFLYAAIFLFSPVIPYIGNLGNPVDYHL